MNIYPFHGKSGLNKAYPYLLILPALFLFVFFGLGPSIVTSILSFTDITTVVYREVNFIGLDNYLEFFRGGTFHEKFVAIRNSIVFTFFVVIIQNSIGLGMALLLNKKWKGRLIARAIIFMPVILGVMVNALMWRLMFFPFGGFVSSFIETIFNYKSAYFSDVNIAFPLVILFQTWMYMGFSMVIFLAGLQTIPAELYESAEIDGVNMWQKFFHITLPIIATSVTVNVLLAVIGALRTFDTIYVTTGGRLETQTLAFYMFSTAFGSIGGGTGRQGFAAAAAMLLFLLISVVTIILLRYLRSREVEL